MEKITMIDAAYMYLKEKKRPIDFYKLFQESKKKANVVYQDDQEAMVTFYTNLTIDGRFACLENNLWTIKEFLSTSEIIVNDDEEDEEVDEEETEEESEYGYGYSDDDDNKTQPDYNDEEESEEDEDSEEEY